MKRLAYALTGLVATAVIAWGANIPLLTGPQDPSQLNATINGVIQQINALITPATMASFSTPRNLLDNGAMAVQQRGTGTKTCGTTTVPTTAYGADRWGCNVNVTSGAGTLQVITSAANLPASPAFIAGHVFYRTSGTLAQPQCVMQEIPTSRVTALQGTTVTGSVYIQGLAAMLAESTTVNMYLFTGTGSDEGLQTFTASPAITPAFTGIATAGPNAFTITSSWARYSGQFSVPATATEAAVALCWTPTTGGTAGVTDGFRFTGVQLEVGGAASSYEFRAYNDELRTAQTFFYRITDNVANTVPITLCHATTTAAVVCVHQFPVTMRAAPTASVSASTAFSDTATAGAPTACTAFSVVASSTSNQTGKTTCTTGATTTAGGASQLVGANTSATLDFTADF